ncbi:threonine synthase [Breznakiella homolactica]|uniref:Threonine synthase n=1 Tax=Breznakiella homolactica TaxID=2798577 RepID=A0A7T8BBD6_9SPIR|nr:threonine synthase [Breznakiella homolactica]QQO10296.1 threonine synthase [Breznakiella homolactica]
MEFRSTRSAEPLVSFKDAVLRCLPPDGGLYIPASVTDMRQFFLYMDEDTSYPELVATVAPSLLQGELNPFSAARVAESAFDFEPELKILDDSLSVLNLYNGPTGVFKDFGIAFLAAIMEELIKNNGRAMILCAARSGGTGASIAHSFYKRKGMTAVILYPAGTVHGLDPALFVPQGGNILPIQIEGNFDDCQQLIRNAIHDRPFAERYSITSANAINVGRLLPQAFYYLYAFVKIKKKLCGDLSFSVPSGNFGNLIAGLYAWKFGMPVNGFIAAMNTNNAFGEYIRGEKFVPRPVVSTISPALDVSNPANYSRLAAFYQESPAVMQNMVFPEVIDDGTTIAAMEQAWKDYGIILDPHGAVAFAAAKRCLGSRDFGGHVVVMATGHPAKYADLVFKVTGQRVEVPENIAALQNEVDPVAVIPPSLDSLQAAIASCC